MGFAHTPVPFIDKLLKNKGESDDYSKNTNQESSSPRTIVLIHILKTKIASSFDKLQKENTMIKKSIYQEKWPLNKVETVMINILIDIILTILLHSIT